MKITKHGQSCFLIEIENSKILIDPGTFVFEDEGLSPKDFSDVDLIIATHEHSDHFDWENVQKIINSSFPTVLGTDAVIDTVKEKYPSLDARTIEPNLSHNFYEFVVEGHASKHGPLPNGKPEPGVIGVVIDDTKTRFYTPGDSIFLDENSKADIVATPICGQVVMTIASAKSELEKIIPKIAIPIHYDSPKYPTDVNEFVRAMQDTDIEVKVLSWGESIEA